MADNKKLDLWKQRLERNFTEYAPEVERMDHREELYRGTKDMHNAHTGKTVLKEATHVRNIIAEIIEAEVDSNIPQPKVTPRRKEDEHLAQIIEDMLRGELDRMRFEEYNDMQERTVPIQGGGLWLVEWDNSLRTHTTIGEVAVSLVHPKQIVPQAGVYTGIEDMDYIILKMPQTKAYIKRKYGVDVKDESEEEPEVKGGEEESAADDMVTQYVAYYRNDTGGIGLFSWVRDTVLEDLDDYQARRLKRCKSCGAVLPYGTKGKGGKKPVCPNCGGTKFVDAEEEYEEIIDPIPLADGTMIPGAQMIANEDGTFTPDPATITKIPYYKPDIYPVILQKNVSLFGKLLGDSDVDKIEDQQNTIKFISTAISDKILKNGSYLTLPRDAKIPADDADGKVIRLDKPADTNMIRSFDADAHIDQDMAYLENVYEQARQVIGITDSFQGRRDTTATSGKAKEFAAQQSAGRLESKRVMKHAAYAALFEAIFKFKLAYTDEPRPVARDDMRGDRKYSEFDRYMFLKQDANGEWYWNTDFLFSCDTAASLATNREAMWQEARLNLQTGAYGNPQDYNTLLMFWGIMEMLHYPYADKALEFVKQQLGIQQQQMAQQQAMMQQQQQLAAEEEERRRQEDNDRADAETQRQARAEEEANNRQMELDTIRQAQEDARADIEAAQARRLQQEQEAATYGR
ncbi:MAG: hypothetical protein II456_05915 [Firmicutes bacterium]|nr:hypothetical protein [Bacillota bacterium]